MARGLLTSHVWPSSQTVHSGKVKPMLLRFMYVKIIFEIDIVDKVCGEKNITNNIEGCCMM